MVTSLLLRMNREVSAVEFKKPELSKNCLSSLYMPEVLALNHGWFRGADKHD